MKIHNRGFVIEDVPGIDRILVHATDGQVSVEIDYAARSTGNVFSLDDFEDLVDALTEVLALAKRVQ